MFFEHQTYSGDHAQWRSFLYAAMLHMVCDAVRSGALNRNQSKVVLRCLLTDEEANLCGESSSAVRDGLDGNLNLIDRFFDRIMRKPESMRCWKALELRSEYEAYQAYAVEPLSTWITQHVEDNNLQQILFAGANDMRDSINERIQQFNNTPH